MSISKKCLRIAKSIYISDNENNVLEKGENIPFMNQFGEDYYSLMNFQGTPLFRGTEYVKSAPHPPRSDYFFAGSHDGAEHAAANYTLVANAKLHNLEPFSYLKDILGRISDHPYKDLDQLLPKTWKKENSSLSLD